VAVGNPQPDEAGVPGASPGHLPDPKQGSARSLDRAVAIVVSVVPVCYPLPDVSVEVVNGEAAGKQSGRAHFDGVPATLQEVGLSTADAKAAVDERVQSPQRAFDAPCRLLPLSLRRKSAAE